jgi:demethylmenaquinone methyltransferase/2-methoxy-6-polyprenyl-1,4-benzoquinol methylase
VPLRATLSTPAGKARYVRGLFATIADRYDLATVLLSFGLDRRWKRRLASMAHCGNGCRALDLACGTGDIAFLLARRGGDVIGLDLTVRMIQLARARAVAEAGAGRVGFVAGDMGALPFGDGLFDLVTTGYGLRNVPDPDGAIAEIRRVLRPGGRVLSLDFNRPAHAPVRLIYHAYLTVFGSVLGWLLHRDPNTYRYIPESIRIYPGAEGIVRLFEGHGFTDVKWFRVLGGLMAIHEARVPGQLTASR